MPFRQTIRKAFPFLRNQVFNIGRLRKEWKSHHRRPNGDKNDRGRTGLVSPRFSLFIGQQTRQVLDKKKRQFLVKIRRQ